MNCVTDCRLMNSKQHICSWEANIFTASQEIPCHLWNMLLHSQKPLLNRIWCVHDLPSYFFKIFFNIILPFVPTGQDSIVGRVTCYGPDGLGIQSQWGWNFLLLSRLALGPTQPPAHWVLGFFAEGKMTGAWFWPPTPHLAPRLRKE